MKQAKRNNVNPCYMDEIASINVPLYYKSVGFVKLLSFRKVKYSDGRVGKHCYIVNKW
jgi:hypothetical protein